MCGEEINRATSTLQRRFRNIHLLLAPVVKTAHAIQELVGDINLKSLCTSEKGSWQFNVWVNATTALPHTERDCSYTLITVPLQHAQRKIKGTHLPKFRLQLQEKHNLTLSYDYHLSFIFSGYYITHNQTAPDKSFNTNYPFINMSSYSNKNVFSHMRTSLLRKLNE